MAGIKLGGLGVKLFAFEVSARSQVDVSYAAVVYLGVGAFVTISALVKRSFRPPPWRPFFDARQEQ